MAGHFQTLPGFRDFYPVDCAVRNYLFDVWRRVARRYGFSEYEGPALEPTDLYRRKSGAEIASQLFCFTDKGDRDVSLRPELTPTLARMAAARQREFKKPLRWFSIGQFFRYEKHQKGRGREFYQFNCDILGEDSVRADAELAALSIDLMRELGFSAGDFRLRVSDRRAWADFAAEAGVGEEALVDFLQIVDKRERMSEEKTAAALAGHGVTPEQIEDFIAGGAESSPLLRELVADLESRGMGEFLEVDLGIVRGLAYYTGAVFELFDCGKNMRAVAGGGRYDGLVELIGGVDMAATGFAMGDMVIADLVRETPGPAEKMEKAVADAGAVDVFVVLADEERRGQANALVQELRARDLRTVLPLAPVKVGKQFQAAEQQGAAWAVVVGREFPEVQLKNLAERSEISLDAGEVADRLA